MISPPRCNPKSNIVLPSCFVKTLTNLCMFIANGIRTWFLEYDDLDLNCEQKNCGLNALLVMVTVKTKYNVK